MKPGSLAPLSRRAEALLAAEREIVPQPERVRRRALLRARTALWRERSHEREIGRGRQLWRRLGLVAAAALVAGSGLAAWISQAPGNGAGEEDKSTAVRVVSGVERSASQASSAAAPVSKPRADAKVADPGADANAADQARSGEQSETAAGAVRKRTAERDPPKQVPSDSRSASRKARTGVSDELALLDRARRAVGRGSYRTALALIDRHARSYPKSELREEREALRVGALEGAGQRRQAEQAANEFEARYPKSVLAPQMNKSGRPSP